MSERTSVEYFEKKISGNKMIISVFQVMPTIHKFRHPYIYIKAKIKLKIFCYVKAIKEYIDEYKRVKNSYSNITKLQALNITNLRIEEKENE